MLSLAVPAYALAMLTDLAYLDTRFARIWIRRAVQIRGGVGKMFQKWRKPALKLGNDPSASSVSLLLEEGKEAP
eukprot:2223398-Rhodomonas_salina.1